MLLIMMVATVIRVVRCGVRVLVVRVELRLGWEARLAGGSEAEEEATVLLLLLLRW